MRIAVVALGKIGLPLAVQFASKGHDVVGVDINPKTVELVNAAREPFPCEAHLGERLEQVVPLGHLRATTDYRDAVPHADAVVVVVPLFVDESTSEPDFAWMDAATRSVAENLTKDTLVIYETTLPVGTTRNRWKPMIEQGSGLVEGIDFNLVFSPERVLTGRVFHDLRQYPKLVGGLDAAGAAKAKEFYEAVLDFDERSDLPRPNGVWDLGSAEAAELAKLAETTFRDVNIGLANQFAVFAENNGIDVYSVIDACNSQPYSHIHRPGIAVGGHCIPVYPQLYLSVDPKASIVREARRVNASMPEYIIDRATTLLGELTGLRVVVLGASYRGGVKETAFSGVFATVAAITERGGIPLVHDPLFSDDELTAYGFTAYHLGEQVDVAVVQADHSDYACIGPSDLPGVRLLMDGRDITSSSQWAGVPRFVIGRGSATRLQTASGAACA